MLVLFSLGITAAFSAVLAMRDGTLWAHGERDLFRRQPGLEWAAEPTFGLRRGIFRQAREDGRRAHAHVAAGERPLVLREATERVFRRARQLANVLDVLGASADARIGTLAWNDYRHLELYYAVSCIGEGTLTLFSLG